jgi:hypothetical protein
MLTGQSTSTLAGVRVLATAMLLGAANRINARIARLADKTEVLLGVGKLADGTVNTSKGKNEERRKITQRRCYGSVL